jgi:hypothetical protein
VKPLAANERVAEQLADASKIVSKPPEEVDDSIHATLIAGKVSGGNLA